MEAERAYDVTKVLLLERGTFGVWLNGLILGVTSNPGPRISLQVTCHLPRPTCSTLGPIEWAAYAVLNAVISTAFDLTHKATTFRGITFS
jgi:hypothetical protein